jgi:hypothetical protein
MERTTQKHTPRVDDELKHETEALVRSGQESHVEEFREQEPPGDGEPEARYGLDDASWGSLGSDAVSARRELSRHLPNAFPADRAALLEKAQEMNAPQEVLDVLGRLPDGQSFENLYDAFETLFGPVEETHESPRRDQ